MDAGAARAKSQGRWRVRQSVMRSGVWTVARSGRAGRLLMLSDDAVLAAGTRLGWPSLSSDYWHSIVTNGNAAGSDRKTRQGICELTCHQRARYVESIEGTMLLCSPTLLIQSGGAC